MGKNLSLKLVLIPFVLISLSHNTAASDWTPIDSGTTAPFSSVWGSSGSDVFVGGVGGIMRHYDGSTWSEMQGFT